MPDDNDGCLEIHLHGSRAKWCTLKITVDGEGPEIHELRQDEIAALRQALALILSRI